MLAAASVGITPAIRIMTPMRRNMIRICATEAKIPILTTISRRTGSIAARPVAIPSVAAPKLPPVDCPMTQVEKASPNDVSRPTTGSRTNEANSIRPRPRASCVAGCDLRVSIIFEAAIKIPSTATAPVIQARSVRSTPTAPECASSAGVGTWTQNVFAISTTLPKPLAKAAASWPTKPPPALLAALFASQSWTAPGIEQRIPPTSGMPSTQLQQRERRPREGGDDHKDEAAATGQGGGHRLVPCRIRYTKYPAAEAVANKSTTRPTPRLKPADARSPRATAFPAQVLHRP